jgi:hypothetical protein
MVIEIPALVTRNSGLLAYILFVCVCVCVHTISQQESVKSRHPQLHYESKLYMLLQGGSKYCCSRS